VRVMIVDDEETVRLALQDLLEDAGHEVAVAEHVPAALAMTESFSPDLILTDLRMPMVSGMELLEITRRDRPETLVVLLTAYGDERKAVEALKGGAWDYVPKPFDNAEILALVDRARELLALRAENDRLRAELGGTKFGIVGRSAAIDDVRRLISRVAPTDATVLITGESGTGKELVARALHDSSPRRRGPFMALNCSALPGELIEAELFGHVRGAFTGAARDREGAFECADGGTLFLDEVGDLAITAQAKLLRVLESREVVKVGASRPRPVDVRIVSATHQPLRGSDGSDFRSDLYYRLAVVEIHVPPLRARREDIPLLIGHFAGTASSIGVPNLPFSEPALRALGSYDWPGNVRELRNVVQRSLVLAQGNEVLDSDLPPEILASDSPISSTEAAALDLPFLDARRRAVAAFDRSFLAAAFERNERNVSRTANVLGMHRQTLQKLLSRYGIGRPRQERPGADGD
jgi:DNA-binding NtrC family response regulator